MNARGQYGTQLPGLDPGRGQYGAPRYRDHAYVDERIGRELTSEEQLDAIAAGNRAAQPLADERAKLMREWPEDTRLSAEQMTQILDEAIKVARETEKNLSTMIDKVPSQWESMLRNERNIINRQLDQSPRFKDLIAKATAPTVVPGFRDHVRLLLRYSEDGVTAIGFVAHVLPNWLRAVSLISAIQSAAVAAIRGVVRIARAAGGVVVDVAESAAGAVKALPAVVKVIGVAALGIGGIWAISKLKGRS